MIYLQKEQHLQTLQRLSKTIACILTGLAITLGNGRNYVATAQVITLPEFGKASPLHSSDTVSICIAGDIMMHTGQITNAHKGGERYDFAPCFSLIKDIITSCDIAIGNMEFTLAGSPYSGYPQFSAPDSYLDAIADCGFDILLAANNHIFDKGSAGADRTLEKCREMKDRIRYCGLAKDSRDMADNHPLVVETKGMKISLLNFTYGTNLGADRHWPKVNRLSDRSSVENAFTKARNCDFVIALPHWGTEYDLLHSQEQSTTAEWLISMGADIIVGSHPHVVQDMTTIRGIPVAYSLGNFISNMSAVNTQLGLVLKVKLVKEMNGSVKAAEIEPIWTWCSRPGGYCGSYIVIPIKDFIGRREQWQGKWDYDKMITTFERIVKLS